MDCDPYRALMEAEMLAAAAVLDFEPAWPGGAVKTSRKGSGSFTLHAHGRASHAGADLSRGANAILELARQCLHISKLTDPVRGVSANVGVIRGGLRSNVVPDLAEAEIDVRFLKVEDGHWIENQLRAIRPEDPQVKLTCPAASTIRLSSAARRWLRVYAQAAAVAAELGPAAVGGGVRWRQRSLLRGGAGPTDARRPGRRRRRRARRGRARAVEIAAGARGAGRGAHRAIGGSVVAAAARRWKFPTSSGSRNVPARLRRMSSATGRACGAW